MDFKDIAIGVIVILLIGLAVYYLTTSDTTLFAENDESVGMPPALPEGGLSGDALRVFANADDSVGNPPEIPQW